MFRPATNNKMDNPVVVNKDSMRTVKQYSILRGITPRAVQLAIKNGWDKPGVIECHLVGNRYILEIDTTFDFNSLKLK